MLLMIQKRQKNQLQTLEEDFVEENMPFLYSFIEIIAIHVVDHETPIYIFTKVGVSFILLKLSITYSIY